MKAHLAPDPVQIRLLGAVREMPHPHLLPRHLQQSALAVHPPYLPGAPRPPIFLGIQWEQELERGASTICGWNDGIYPVTLAPYL